MSTFGDRLRALRIEGGMTQDRLALEIGVTKGAVSQWELGGNEPDMSSVVAIRNILAGSLDGLICGRGSPDGEAATPTKRETAFLQRLRNLPAEKQAAVLALFGLQGEPWAAPSKARSRLRIP